MLFLLDVFLPSLFVSLSPHALERSKLEEILNSTWFHRGKILFLPLKAVGGGCVCVGGGGSEMKEIARTQERDNKVENEEESELIGEVERREGWSGVIKMGGQERTRDEKPNVINPPLCDTLDCRGASQHNIHVY